MESNEIPDEISNEIPNEIVNQIPMDILGKQKSRPNPMQFQKSIRKI